MDDSRASVLSLPGRHAAIVPKPVPTPLLASRTFLTTTSALVPAQQSLSVSSPESLRRLLQEHITFKSTHIPATHYTVRPHQDILAAVGFLASIVSLCLPAL
ncbi:hypothetical protein LshimejAT787_1602470 [Lyophyllum shimeji]|uniref:Uncharacterized protein n=1 Tax=Lyophyllum shimeji TaxID=47721 RepID=A0A9P3PWK4_LYOSH|nr:hypothetical protein LshimejAT787_1602470 [Lyophyllum shimeji]